MYEHFTLKAKKSMLYAQAEVRRLGHNYVGSEAILLGLIIERSGFAAQVLDSMGVNQRNGRLEVEKIIGRGSGLIDEEISFTPRARQVMALAWNEATELKHNYIGTEHLLLGLISDIQKTNDDGVAQRVLFNLRVDIPTIRERVLALLEKSIKVEYPTLRSSGLEMRWTNPYRCCPNCAESIPGSAKSCGYCGYGISDSYFTDCSFCRERIRKGARTCKFCKSVLAPAV